MGLILIPRNDQPSASLESNVKVLEARISHIEEEFNEFNRQRKEFRRIIIGALVTIISSVIAVLIKLIFNI